MRVNYLAKFLVDMVFKGQDMKVVLRDANEDGDDFDISNVNVQDGVVSIWFNRNYPIKK